MKGENMKQTFSVFALLTLGVTSGCVPTDVPVPGSWPGMQLGFPPPIWYKPPYSSSKLTPGSYHRGSDQKKIEIETEEEARNEPHTAPVAASPVLAHRRSNAGHKIL